MSLKSIVTHASIFASGMFLQAGCNYLWLHDTNNASGCFVGAVAFLMLGIAIQFIFED